MEGGKGGRDNFSRVCELYAHTFLLPMVWPYLHFIFSEICSFLDHFSSLLAHQSQCQVICPMHMILSPDLSSGSPLEALQNIVCISKLTKNIIETLWEWKGRLRQVSTKRAIQTCSTSGGLQKNFSSSWLMGWLIWGSEAWSRHIMSVVIWKVMVKQAACRSIDSWVVTLLSPDSPHSRGRLHSEVSRAEPSKTVLLKHRYASVSAVGIKTQICWVSLSMARPMVAYTFLRNSEILPYYGRPHFEKQCFKAETQHYPGLEGIPDYGSIPSCPEGRNRIWSWDELGFISMHL